MIGGESEHNVLANANVNEQRSSPTIKSNPTKKPDPVPKIWMDFNDFCTCFTSIIVFHNPRAYSYYHKHTEIKVNQILTTYFQRTRNLIFYFSLLHINQ